MCSVKPEKILQLIQQNEHVFVYHGATAPSGPRPSHYREFTIKISFTHHNR